MTEKELDVYEAAMELLRSAEGEELAAQARDLEEELGRHFALGLEGLGLRLTVEVRQGEGDDRLIRVFGTRKALSQFAGQGFI